MTVPPAPLQLHLTTPSPTILDVAVTGDLDVVTADQLHTCVVEAVIRHNAHAVTLDLSRLRFIDVAGIRALYRLHALTAAAGCKFSVATAHQVFWWTLSRLGLEPEFASR